MRARLLNLSFGALAAALLIASPAGGQEVTYAPEFNAAEFTTEITNPYFRMPIGRRLHYREDTEDGRELTEVWVTGERRTVMGVETLVLLDRVHLNDELIEETKDYVAQNRVTGDVWYFGENVDNYEDGRFLDHNGTWIAGENGARPGVWIKGDPRPGDVYQQEYYRGEAEDMARVEAVNETVRAAGRTYSDCVRTFDWTPLEPTVAENKFYCRDVGATVLELDRESGARSELISIDEPN